MMADLLQQLGSLTSRRVGLSMNIDDTKDEGIVKIFSFRLCFSFAHMK